MHGGSVEKALNVKNRENEYIKLEEIFGNLEKIDIIDIIGIKEEIFTDKKQAEELLNYISLIFYDKIRTNSKYIECIRIVEDTKNRLSKNNNFDMTIDNFIITIWEEINEKYHRS